MINLKKTKEIKKENYKRTTYEYDKNTDLVVSMGEDDIGEFKMIKIIKKSPHQIPHDVNVILNPYPSTNAKINIRFHTPLYSDEKKEIMDIFDYYTELETFINQHYQEFWENNEDKNETTI